MASCREVRLERAFMGRLEHGADLLEELTAVAVANGVRLGRVEALGAVRRATVGFYDQGTRTYAYRTLERPLEITSLVGNVSCNDGKPILHAHITLADEAGHAFGGHLAAGTVIFACEFILQAFSGPEFARGLDEATGLPLWQM